LLVAKASLSEERPMTTNHPTLEDLRKTGVQIVKAGVVDDGDLETYG
jgi:hypothetical protein